MEICKSMPPLYKLQERQTASCFLYQDQPELDREQLSEVLPV